MNKHIKLIAATLAALISYKPTMNAEPLNVGDVAPDVAVALDDGTTAQLADSYKKDAVLVYFYPKSFTGGCTKQACNLRDNYPKVTETGITVFGVSGDDVETQAKFRAEYELPFHLVADTEGSLAKAFGVPLNGVMPKRQSFLVVDGKIAWRDLQANPVTQAEDALAAYAELN